MDMRRLQVLQTLGRYGTVRATADALHVSASSVSQQINLLEAESGVTLLEKDGRSVRLTPAARLLIEHAHVIFSELESAHSDLRAYKDGELSVTSAGAFASAIPELLAPATVRLGEQRPRWRVHVAQVEPEHSVDQLISGDLDLAVTMSGRHLPSRDHPQVRLQDLLTEPYDAVLRTDDPLCARETLNFADDLANREWILSAPDTAWHDCTVAAANQVGFQPQATHTVDDFAAAIGLVRAGLGVTLLPRMGWRAIGISGVCVRPVTSAPSRQIFAVVRRGDHSSALLDVLSQIGATLSTRLPDPTA